MLGINNYIHKAPQLVISALELFEKAENGDIWQELENENKDWVWFVCRPESDYLEATKNDIQQANETSVTNNVEVNADVEAYVEADVEADVEAEEEEEEEDARGLDPRSTERNNRYDFYSQMYSQMLLHPKLLHPITLSNKITNPI